MKKRIFALCSALLLSLTVFRGLRIKTDGGERRKRAGSDCHGCSDGKGGIFRSREHRGTHGSTFHGTGECEPAHRPADLDGRRHR